MDHLDIDEAVIVGCSMGGGAALDVAMAAPYRVSGLVLVGSGAPGFDVEEYESPQWPAVLEAYAAGDMARVAELDAEIWVIGYGRSREDVDPKVIATMIEMDLAILPNEDRRDELLVAIDPPRSERMGEITVPTLVVVGEHDLPNVRESATLLAGALSHHEAVVIPGAAHLPSLEQPEVFNRAVIGFLRSFPA
jgi:pimeloyl-ACP methyl ester carboxylesterase